MLSKASLLTSCCAAFSENIHCDVVFLHSQTFKNNTNLYKATAFSDSVASSLQ